MFNVGDFVIIVNIGNFLSKDRFIIDKIKNIDGSVLTFINSNFEINLEKGSFWTVLSYEEGLPYIMKSKIITEINNCLKNLSVDYSDYEDVSEEELNDLLLKVQSFEEDIKNVNKRYLRKYEE